MYLKDRGRNQEEYSASKAGKGKIHEPCKRYNRGKCTYGAVCRYDHCCAVKKCGKFGHRAHICRLKDSASGQHDINAGAGASATSALQNRENPK